MQRPIDAILEIVKENDLLPEKVVWGSLSRIRSEAVKRMMRRVECVTDSDLEKTFPKQWCATAEIFTKDGKRYFTKVEYCKGDPENSLSWD